MCWWLCSPNMFITYWDHAQWKTVTLQRSSCMCVRELNFDVAPLQHYVENVNMLFSLMKQKGPQRVCLGCLLRIPLASINLVTPPSISVDSCPLLWVYCGRPPTPLSSLCSPSVVPILSPRKSQSHLQSYSLSERHRETHVSSNAIRSMATCQAKIYPSQPTDPEQ